MLQLSCCNGFGLGKGFYVVIEFGQDQGFYVMSKFGQGKRFYVAIENSMS